MKLVVLSDFHIHDYKQMTHFVNGQNSRLEELLNCLNKLVEKVNSYEPDRIIFLGDLFHVKGFIKPSVAIRTFDILKNLKAPVYAIDGNHDLENEGGISALDILKYLNPMNKVFHKPALEDGFLFIPYFSEKHKFIETLVDFRGTYDFVCSHEMIMQKNMFMKANEILVSEISSILDGSVIFNGHIHEPYAYQNLINVGSPFKHSFNDVGREANFLVYDTDNKSWFFDSVNDIEFISVDSPLFDTKKITGNYVCVEVFEGETGKMIVEKVKLFKPKGLKVKLKKYEIIDKINTANNIKKIDLNTIVLEIIKTRYADKNTEQLLSLYDDIMEEVINEIKIY